MSRRSDKEVGELFDRKQLTAFRKKILAWYRQAARDLPWRKTKDPYAIWISEIMLQQTQVVTVIPYFLRFLKSFPTVVELAAASEEKVLAHWEGLGYYRRARQLHAAARRIVSNHGGVFPQAFDGILALPGIGRYTAGAIASFAFNDARPILEANTQRLYARLLAWEKRLSLTDSKTQLWAFAEQLVNCDEPALLNQSLMELGSLVCRPKDPDCSHCPVKGLCRANLSSMVESIPAAEEKTVYEERDEAALLLNDSKSRWLVRLCRDGERWAGLWDFPRYDVSGEPDHGAQLSQMVREDYGFQVDVGQKIHVIKHGVTKYRITLHVYQAAVMSPSKKRSAKLETQWVSLQELKRTPLNASARRIATMLEKAAKLG